MRRNLFTRLSSYYGIFYKVYPIITIRFHYVITVSESVAYYRSSMMMSKWDVKWVLLDKSLIFQDYAL